MEAGAPWMEMVPLSGSIKEAIMDKSVDFPQPLGPTMARNSPSGTEKVIFDKAGVSPESV